MAIKGTHIDISEAEVCKVMIMINLWNPKYYTFLINKERENVIINANRWFAIQILKQSVMQVTF